MLPTPADVARAAERVAADSNVPIVLREAAVRSALREAEHLVTDDVDVPAALHFTFTRHRDVFSRDASRVLAVILHDVASRVGIKILASDAELHARLAHPPESVEDARDWFAGRVVMYGG